MTTRNLVGIGTTDPQYTLDVAGDLNITGGLFTNGQNASGSLYWTETVGENIITSANVGIGITGEPVAPLHVGGNARIDGNLTVNGTQTVINTNVEETSRIEVINNGTGPAMVVNQTGAQPVADFQDDGVSAFFIADGGNVGIGTTNPSGKFNVAISGPTSFANQSEGTIAFGNATSGVGAIMPAIQAKSNGTDRIGLNLQSGTTDANSNPDMRFNVRTSTDTDFATLTSRAFDFTRLATPLMTILRNGNVGIGVTNPAENLHVQSNARVNNLLIDTTPTQTRIGHDGSGLNDLLVYSRGNVEIAIDSNSSSDTRAFIVSHNAEGGGSELMRVQENGNVGIGLTNPISKLDINISQTSLGIDTQPNGVISFGDGSTGGIRFPAMLGKTTGIAVGLTMVSSVPNALKDGEPDMRLDTRTNSNTDFDSDKLASRAFSLSRINNDLVSVLRNGNVGIGRTEPPARLSVATPSVATASTRSARSLFGNASVNQMDVSAIVTNDIIFDHHTRATLTATAPKTFVQASTVQIDGPPIAGTNVTLTNTASLNVVSGDIKHNGAVWAAPAGTAPLYAARAWVNFDGTATTPAIRASGNVSSITRNGIGSYTIDFTTSLPDSNYSVVAISGAGGTSRTNQAISTGTKTISSARIFNADVYNNAAINASDINVVILR